MSEKETRNLKSFDHAVDAFSGTMKAFFLMQERAVVAWADAFEPLREARMASQKMLGASAVTIRESTHALAAANLYAIRALVGRMASAGEVIADITAPVATAQAEVVAATAQVIAGVAEAGTDVALAATMPPLMAQSEYSSVPAHAPG